MVLSPRRDATQHSTTASQNELVVRRARDIRNTFILLEREQRNPQTLSRRATRDAASEAASACAARVSRNRHKTPTSCASLPPWRSGGGVYWRLHSRKSVRNNSVRLVRFAYYFGQCARNGRRGVYDIL